MGILKGLKGLFGKEPEEELPISDELYTRLAELGDDSLGRRVMLVDPSAFERGMNRSLLEKYGFVIAAETNSGAECLRLYRACKPDVVLMRASLYQSNGLDALTELKREEPSAQVIMCEDKNNATETLVTNCVLQGAKDFMLLPINPERLMRSVYTLCPVKPEEAGAVLAARDQAREQERAEREAAEAKAKAKREAADAKREAERAAASAAAREAGKLIMLITTSGLFDLPWEIRDTLDKHGYRLVAVFSTAVEDYLPVYRREQPNLVILLSLVKPEVLENLKKEDPSTAVLVYLPAKNTVVMEERLKQGAADCVSAPIQPDAFLERVERLCRPPER